MFVPAVPWLRFILFPAASILSAAVGSDYSLIGPIVIYGMVMGRKNWGKYVVAFFIIGYGVYALVSGVAGVILTCFYTGIWMVIVCFYHGNRGREGRKRIFYWFYPVHLIILWAVRTLCR